jgi:alpha-1,3-mannosyltransferase
MVRDSIDLYIKLFRTLIYYQIDIISMMFTSNFIGIIFARSLHYQFYSWYFQTIPYLLWQCSWQSSGSRASFQNTARILIFVSIEGCWLTFPSTVRSSWTLMACHLMILLGFYGYAPAPNYKLPNFLKSNE